jgi:hypothetical protein
MASWAMKKQRISSSSSSAATVFLQIQKQKMGLGGGGISISNFPSSCASHLLIHSQLEFHPYFLGTKNWLSLSLSHTHVVLGI